MLLVKSRESKNSGSNPVKSVVKSIGYAFPSSLPVGLFCTSAVAQDSQTMSSAGSIASIFLSLLLVVMVIFALAWVLRQFNVTQSGNGDMQVVASMMAGTKERVMVIQVGDEQHLLGITPQNINHLAKLDVPLSHSATKKSRQFQNKLALAMKGRLTENSEQSIQGKHS